MWSCMPLISLLLRWKQEDQTWKTSLRCVSSGGDDDTSWQFSFCMLIVSIENGGSDFPFLYVLSCPVAPLQVFTYPCFMTLCLYRFLSVIHGWVCWVSWSCQFVILIWNSFTIIGPGHCSVCLLWRTPVSYMLFGVTHSSCMCSHVVWSYPQLMHVPFLVFLPPYHSVWFCLHISKSLSLQCLVCDLPYYIFYLRLWFSLANN